MQILWIFFLNSHLIVIFFGDHMFNRESGAPKVTNITGGGVGWGRAMLHGNVTGAGGGGRGGGWYKLQGSIG